MDDHTTEDHRHADKRNIDEVQQQYTLECSVVDHWEGFD